MANRPTTLEKVLTFTYSQGRDGRSRIVAFIGLQDAGRERVHIAALVGFCGHVHRHRAGAIGWDRARRR